MSRGFYIIANDKVTEHAIALLESIRATDSETPVMLIPYDDHYQKVARILSDRFGVLLFEDLEFIQRLSVQLQSIFGQEFFARPNQFRKQACWFGPFDEFLYIDTDLIVFEPIIQCLDALSEADFVCYDYQHAGGLKDVFTSTVLEQGIFTEEDLRGTFNGGLWGSRKGLITEQDLYDTFAECAAHPEYFDFSKKTSDQPIINYMVLRRFPRRWNWTQRPAKGPGSWAGSKHFVWQGDRLIDPKVNKPVPYLHWAGIRLQPGCPYWELWEKYRYLHEPKPTVSPLAPPPPRSIWQRALTKAKRILKPHPKR